MNQRVTDNHQDISLQLVEDINLQKCLQQLSDAGLLFSQHWVSIEELINPENATPSFETILTVDEAFRKVNVEAEDTGPELGPGPILTDSEALAAVSGILPHIEGTGIVAGLRFVSSLQKYLDLLEYEVGFGNKTQVYITD